MDKMGSSAVGGNKGLPATPRDGAPVEIIGLLKSTLRWLSSLHRSIYPHTEVVSASGRHLSYSDWNFKLQDSFEATFWVKAGETSKEARRREIYKDTVGATRSCQDWQLRPNFCIAMAVAPELFTEAKAKKALQTVSSVLVGPLGMCTLDPEDPEYRGDYVNSYDGTDKAIAQGWNYHQGPEWVWPLGYFLRAQHQFSIVTDPGQKSAAAVHCLKWLRCHRSHLQCDPWRSLPELTNSKGQLCFDSCPAQAWSIATLLDALQIADAEAVEENKTNGAAQEQNEAPQMLPESQQGQTIKATNNQHLISRAVTLPAPVSQHQDAESTRMTRTDSGLSSGSASPMHVIGSLVSGLRRTMTFSSSRASWGTGYQYR
jgi:glycogen debranching enzyme